MLTPALVWAAVIVAAEPKDVVSDLIQHEQLQDSSNATRVFCIKINAASENSLLMPTVLLEFNGNSMQLQLRQSKDDPTVFRGVETFDGPGLVEYIITAGTAFWAPENSSVASFRQLPSTTTPTVTTVPTLPTVAAEKEVDAEQTNHTGYYNDTGAMFYVFVVFFVLLFIFFASAVFV